MPAGPRRHLVTLVDRPQGRPAVVMNPSTMYVAIQPEAPSVEDEDHVTHVVTGEWHSQVSTDTVLQYEGRDLRVLGVRNDEERGRSMTLFCHEVKTPAREAQA